MSTETSASNRLDLPTPERSQKGSTVPRRIAVRSRAIVFASLLGLAAASEAPAEVVYKGMRALHLDLSHRPSHGYEVSRQPDAERIQFIDGKHPAAHWRIDFEAGHQVQLYRAKVGGPWKLTPDAIAKALSYLPLELLVNVQDVLLDPADRWTALAQGPWNPEKRGRMHIYRLADTHPPATLAGIVCHEAGHIVINRHWAAGKEPWISYEKAIETSSNHPSEYARASRFEDFAEAVELYAWAEGRPEAAQYRRALPKRYAFLDEHVFASAALRPHPDVSFPGEGTTANDEESR